MSYHGPRDNGEGRVGPERTLPPLASAPRSVPIPESLRVAWFLNRTSTSTAEAKARTSTTTEDDQPENTTPPPSPSIIQLLRIGHLVQDQDHHHLNVKVLKETRLL